MPISLPRCFILCAAGAVAGCEQPIDLGDEGAARIVINSQLRVGAGVEVRMDVLNSFGDIAESPELDRTLGYIFGSDGSADTLYVASFNTSVAVLRTDRLTVAEGVTYDLTLEAPGFAPLSSVTTVPEAARFAEALEGDAIGRPTADSTLLSVALSFEDIADADNYYHLLVRVAEASQLGSGAPAEGALLAGRSVLNSRDGKWLFDDRGFADGTFEGHVVFDADQMEEYDDPVAVIELQTVSRAYYKHLLSERQRDRQPASSTASASSDNVLGGGGLFGSYSVSTLTRAIR